MSNLLCSVAQGIVEFYHIQIALKPVLCDHNQEYINEFQKL